MKRLKVIVAHLLVLPAAVLLSLALMVVVPTTYSQPAVDVALHDTYFVVAHLHASIVLGSCVGMTTLVAYRYGHSNRALGGAWALLLLHLVAAFIPWGPRSVDAVALESATLTVMPPSHPGLAYVYIASALGGFLASLLSLLISLIRGLQSQGAGVG